MTMGLPSGPRFPALPFPSRFLAAWGYRCSMATKRCYHLPDTAHIHDGQSQTAFSSHTHTTVAPVSLRSEIAFLLPMRLSGRRWLPECRRRRPIGNFGRGAQRGRR
jgi:hypothetical protein